MDKRSCATTSAYQQSMLALRGLHRLNVLGEEEGAEADELRDILERFWNSLTDAEQNRTSELSGDLNSICRHRADPAPIDPLEQERLNEDLLTVAGQLDETLDVLRRWAPRLASADLSNRRGLAWEAAGDRETAAIFFEHAGRVATSGRDHAIARAN